MTASETTQKHSRSKISQWREITQTCNSSNLERLDPFGKFLIIVRACVFPLTINAGLIGGFLALVTHGYTNIDWVSYSLALLGIVLAHAANNMINDYFDTAQGVDIPEYVRALYAPHPILSGIISKRKFEVLIILINLVDLAIGVFLYLKHGLLVLIFAGIGFFISLFYVAPPLKLKHKGLGEIGVTLVWGPLMIGGVYYVAVGEISPVIWLASIPYGLLAGAMLLGKHIDKLEFDKEKRIYTLPVILGEKASRRLVQFLLLLFVVWTAGLAFLPELDYWMLLVLFSVRRLWLVLQIYNKPKPEVPPEDYPVWPLWYVSFAFYYIKQAGTFFFLGLLLSAIFPLS